MRVKRYYNKERKGQRRDELVKQRKERENARVRRIQTASRKVNKKISKSNM